MQANPVNVVVLDDVVDYRCYGNQGIAVGALLVQILKVRYHNLHTRDCTWFTLDEGKQQ